MIFGDLGALVTVEAIDTGAVGVAVASTGVCAIETQSSSAAGAHTAVGYLGTLSKHLSAIEEFLVSPLSITGTQAETLAPTRGDLGALLEWLLLARAADAKAGAEILPQARHEDGTPVAWSGAVMVVRDGPAIIEVLTNARGSSAGGAEYLAGSMAHASLFEAWLEVVIGVAGKSVELNEAVLRDRPALAEWVGSAGSIDTIDVTVWLEWTEDLPSLISVGKLLRSPGRVRLLGANGRVRLLKGN
jgi:hypothetical protein